MLDWGHNMAVIIINQDESISFYLKF